MSTMAIIAFIDLDNSTRYVELTNDGDLAGKILKANYNSFNAAKAITSGGVISILKPAMHDSIFHAANWGRELRETVTTVETLFAMADVIGGQGEDASPIYVFDAREYYDDYTQFNDFHYHKMYGMPQASGSPFESKQYWKRLNEHGKLIDIIG